MQQLSEWGQQILRTAQPGDRAAIEDAYVLLREKEGLMEAQEGALLRQGLEWKLRGGERKSWLLVLFSSLFALLSGGMFHSRVQDLFAFLGETFRPYMYVAVTIPLLINLVLAALQLRRAWKMHQISCLMQLKGKGQAVGMALLALLLLGFSGWKLSFLAQDLPAVMKQEYATGIVTEERVDEWAMYNAMLYRGTQEPLENPPIPWCQNPEKPAWMAALTSDPYNRSVYEINVNGQTMRMSSLQFEMMKVPSYEELPFLVEYLPHSGLVLWISSAGGDGT